MADLGIGAKKEAPKPPEKKGFFNFGKAEAAAPPPPPGAVGDVKGSVNAIKKRNQALKEAMGE